MAGRARADSRRVVRGSLQGVGVVLALILFVIANYFGWKYHARLDWTGTSLYTLSEKSLAVIDQLDRDVEITVFVSPGEQLYGPMAELLSRYDESSERLSVRFVDPEKSLLESQALVERFELTQLNVLVFDSGDDRRVVDTADLAEYDYSGMQFGEGAKLTAFRGEQVFTSTLLELMESRKPRILFTTGHGEMGLDDPSERGLSLARDLLGRDNFELIEWASIGANAVPVETDLVVVAGPTSNFLESELQVLEEYLDTGGRALFLLDPVLAPDGSFTRTGLEPLLAGYGVQVGPDVVVDPANPLPFFGAETIFVNVYGDHVITRPLDQAQLPVVIPLGRSVRADPGATGLSVTELILTSIEGWGETDLDNLTEVALGDGDLPGPVSLAVAVEPLSSVPPDPGMEGEESPFTRLVVVGDADLASNSQMQNVPNATFIANAFNWLVDRETLVGIPPKTPEQVRLNLSRTELGRLTWLVLLILPGAAVVIGLIVFLRRRR